MVETETTRLGSGLFVCRLLVGVGAFVEFFMELVGSIDRFVNGLTGATSC